MQRYFTLKLKVFFLLSFFFYLFIAYSPPLNATIRYVSKTGNSTPPYITWETAADSIQKCINICVFGDTIYVANGVYQEQVVMIPGLSLIGAGTDSCYIDTRDLVTSLNFTSVSVAGNCLLKGFLIMVNYNSDEGVGIGGVGNVINSLITENRITTAYEGIYLGGNPTIYKNNIDGISIGIELFNSNAVVKNNIVYTDPFSQLSLVVGVYIGAFNNNYQPTIDSNFVVTSLSFGIYQSFGSRPIIKNNVIVFTRYGSNAIDLAYSDSAFVYNNLILIGTGLRGIYNINIPNLQARNNYIQGNESSSQLGMLIGGSNLVKNNVVTNTDRGIQAGGIQNLEVRYNNLWNNNINYYGFTADTTNISFDPMVMNNDSTKGDLDFHLQAYSPLIDAGDPNILDKDSTRSDIGLYGGPYGESYVYVDLPPRTPVNLTANVDSLIKLNWNRNTEADFSYYNVYRDTAFNFTVDSTKLIASVTDTLYYHTFPINVETLYYKLTAVDNQGNESNPSEQVSVKLVTVKNEWVPVNNYILYQNYPNPFNPSTKIGYKLKERGYVKLYVYDIKGELVSVLVNDVQEAGYYEIEFDTGSPMLDTGTRNLASGVYIYQIFVKGENNIPVFSDIKKMVYVK